MSSETYELIAQTMRYVFLLAIAIFTVRVFFQELAEKRLSSRIRHQLPDAGLIGELIDVTSNDRFYLPYEGFVANEKWADIRFKHLKRGQKLYFSFVPHRGILLKPLGTYRFDYTLDDQPLSVSAYASHGSYITIGDHRLMLRLFEGLPLPSLQER